MPRAELISGGGQLGDVVHDELWGPFVDDGLELRGAWLQLKVGEDLGEKEPALLVAAEPLEPGKAWRPLISETLRRAHAEGLESAAASSLVVGLPVAKATT